MTEGAGRERIDRTGSTVGGISTGRALETGFSVFAALVAVVHVAVEAFATRATRALAGNGAGRHA